MKSWIKNNWHLLALVVMMLVVAIPFFIADRQFPAQADDTTRFIEEVQSGQHAGYYLKHLSIPIVKLAEHAGCSPAKAFQWFDLMVVLVVMVVLYFVFSRLVSKWAALMSVYLSVFCSMGITMLFYSGTIFSVVNVFIILPLGLYFVIRWLVHQRVYQAVLGGLLLAAFSVGHPTGMYLLPILLIFFAIVLCAKRYRNGKTVAVFVVIVIATACSIPAAYTEIRARLAEPTVMVSVSEFVMKYVRVVVALLLAFAVLLLVKKKDILTAASGQHSVQLLAAVLLSAVLVLIPIAFLGLNLGRSILDLAGILALLTACLLGMCVQQDKTRVLAPALWCVALVGSAPMLRMWLLGTTGAGI